MKTVIIDAGHGGYDPGAVSCFDGVTYEEKWFNIQVAHKLQTVLLLSRNFRVFMTRQLDHEIYPSWDERVQHSGIADAFISIHMNASPSERPSGCETFALNERCRGHRLAKAVNVRLAASLQDFWHRRFPDIRDGRRNSFRNRGVKTASFKVLRTTICPAALVEVGFITNPLEGPLSHDATPQGYLWSAALGISSGLCDFLNV